MVVRQRVRLWHRLLC